MIGGGGGASGVLAAFRRRVDELCCTPVFRGKLLEIGLGLGFPAV